MCKTIAIDIGHGNNTFELKKSKFVIVNGIKYEEHDFNSKVGVELDKILRRHGFKTLLYQQPNSPEISLTQRINYYNSLKVDLVCSIHANAGTSTAKGLAAFYWHTSKESKKLADLYADEVKSAGYETYGSGSRASVPNTWSDFAICRDSKMNAILTENGFMTNQDDFKLIFQSENFIIEVAKIHAKAICKFYNVEYQEEIPVQEVKSESPLPLPTWDGIQFKNGQIGRLTILKPINLWKRVGDKLEMVRILQPNEVYRVYGYDQLNGGQFNLGGVYVTNMSGYTRYETPSPSLLEKAAEYYQSK